MSEYIKLTWQKLAIILIGIFFLVSGWSILSAQFDTRTIKIDIEASENVARNEAKV
jgi:hypothetical protein